jgi:hypothetical protein
MDVDRFIDELKTGKKCLAENDLRILCEKAKELLQEESNV